VTSSIRLPVLFLAAGPSGGSGLSFIVLLGALGLIWYFLIIRPQSRQRHKTQEMLGGLKTGDRVVTTGGLLGTIAGFGSNTVQLQISNQVKVEVLRSAIAGPQKGEEGSGDKNDRDEKKGGEAAEREAQAAGKGRK
jgi:preprotein translocase subunit YajC